jgi:hypothetical protein
VLLFVMMMMLVVAEVFCCFLLYVEICHRRPNDICNISLFSALLLKVNNRLKCLGMANEYC